MENNNQTPPRQPNPRRRKRDPMRVFVEAYLPVVIVVVLFLFLLGAIILGVVGCTVAGSIAKQASADAEESRLQQQAQDLEEAEAAIAQAHELALVYDYEGAIAALDAFGNRIYDHQEMLELRDSYVNALNSMVAYSGSDVVHISVQVLIADSQRAFSNKEYGNSFKKNFITTQEFSNLLQQLYNNNYVLVDMEDFVEAKTSEAGNTVFTEKTLMLPAGKKPLMLTQTQVNYYSYMVDPDNDGIPDKNGSGFASKLILENGELKNEMVSASGETVTGNYDLVPILEDFIRSHPDFSFQGARAVLAVTGYNGIFGYRGDSLSEAAPVLDALRQKGYEIAYYTYYNSDFSSETAEEIADEAQRWEKNIVPVLGQTSYMVFARSGDIAKSGTAYSGDKFDVLQDMGLRYYLGFCTDGEPWFLPESSYVRMGRIITNAENLTTNPQWFEGICDPASVLTENR